MKAGPILFGEEFKPGRYGLTSVIALARDGAVLAHVNCAWNNGEQIARQFAASDELLLVMRDVAALLPIASRMHPTDLFALQSRVCAVIDKAQGEPSALCAVCDQIKELHSPAMHPWAPKVQS
jgi:hypothetical protein